MRILFGDLSFDRQFDHPLRYAYGPKRFYMWYLQTTILHKSMLEVSILPDAWPRARWWRSPYIAGITWDITATNANCIAICVHTAGRVSPIGMFYPNTSTFTPASVRTSAMFVIAVSFAFWFKYQCGCCVIFIFSQNSTQSIISESTERYTIRTWLNVSFARRAGKDSWKMTNCLFTWGESRDGKMVRNLRFT